MMPGAQFAIEFEPDSYRKFQKLTDPATFDKPFRKFVSGFLDDVVDTAKDNAPVDTGKLRSSIRRSATPGTAGTGYGGYVTAGVSYALFVEKGTRPHWPPPGALAGWANRHGIPAFLVGRKIAREGTKPNPFLSTAWAATEKTLPKRLSAVATEVEAIWR